jgi:hypothetical protein
MYSFLVIISGINMEIVKFAPSIEAANTAIRLVSDLMIPDGARIRYKRPDGPVMSGWVKGYNRLGRLAVSPYEDCPPNPTIFVSPESRIEIMRLPPDCPPLSEWLRVPDVLMMGDSL